MYDHRVIGWRERLGLPAIKAKIDSATRSPSLRLASLKANRRDGIVWLQSAATKHCRSTTLVQCDAPAADRREVTDSGGHVSQRWFVHTMLELAGTHFEIENNLTNRRSMLFPMMLGRAALSGRFRVDPARSYVFGNRREENLQNGRTP